MERSRNDGLRRDKCELTGHARRAERSVPKVQEAGWWSDGRRNSNLQRGHVALALPLHSPLVFPATRFGRDALCHRSQHRRNEPPPTAGTDRSNEGIAHAPSTAYRRAPRVFVATGRGTAKDVSLKVLRDLDTVKAGREVLLVVLVRQGRRLEHIFETEEGFAHFGIGWRRFAILLEGQGRFGTLGADVSRMTGNRSVSLLLGRRGHRGEDIAVLLPPFPSDD